MTWKPPSFEKTWTSWWKSCFPRAFWRSGVRRIRSLIRLAPNERGILLLAAVLMPVTALAVRLLGFKLWAAALVRIAPMPIRFYRYEDPSPKARRIARLVRAAALRGPFKANCLQHSMALWCILRRNDIDSHLRIGARKDGDNFEAHAWVELEGRPLNDEPEVRERF